VMEYLTGIIISVVGILICIIGLMLESRLSKIIEIMERQERQVKK